MVLFLSCRWSFSKLCPSIDRWLLGQRLVQLSIGLLILVVLMSLLKGYNWDIQVLAITSTLGLLAVSWFEKPSWWGNSSMHQFKIWTINVAQTGLLVFVLTKYLFNTSDALWPIIGFGILSLLGLYVLQSKKPTIYAVASRMWALFPVLVILSFELALVLNQRGISGNFSVWFFLFGFSVLFLALIRSKDLFPKLPRLRLEQYQIPVFLVSLFTVCAYQVVVTDRLELFEMANPAHSVMRVFEFGELPFFDFLSSHMLSEQLLQYLYSLANGYQNDLSFNAYLFVFAPFSALIYFLFLKKILHSVQWAFILVLCYPFVSIILDFGYFWALITVFLVHKTFQKPSIRNGVWVIAWSVFLIFWRIDIAAASLPGLVILALLHLLKERFDKKAVLTWLIPAALIGLAGILAFGASVVLVEHSPFESIKQALDYFGAAQAHAFTKIATDYSSFKFIFHHMLLPLVVVLIFLHTLFKWWKSDFDKKQSFTVTAILVLALFYFFNAQRGLVRHSFMEGSDRYISSFAYLIIPLFLLLEFNPRKRVFVFLLSGTVFLIAARYQTLNYLIPNFTAVNALKLNETPYDFEERIERSAFKTNNQAQLKTINEISMSLSTQLKGDKTFLDFSNTPMLYFYSGKRVPSYFNQYLQNTVTPYLQEQNIALLEESNVPCCLFSHMPDTWWDNVDGVPNAIRHAELCRYIYENYHPKRVESGFQIWLKNEKNQNRLADSSVFYPKNYNLKYYPAFYRYQTTEQYEVTEWDESSTSTHLVAKIEKPDIGMSLQLVLEKGAPNQKVIIQYFKGNKALGQYVFTSYKEFTSYKIPLWAQYNWHLLGATHIQVTSPTPLSIQKSRLFQED